MIHNNGLVRIDGSCRRSSIIIAAAVAVAVIVVVMLTHPRENVGKERIHFAHNTIVVVVNSRSRCLI